METHFIKSGNKPVAVLMDYEEYKRIMDYLEDKIDLETLKREKNREKNFTTLEEYKKELELLSNE